jgi:hypothetical protein
VQVLFALNKRYFVNEKGSVKATSSFPLRPDEFEETVSSVLAAPGEDPAQLRASVRRLEELVQTAREMSTEHLLREADG